MAEVTPSTMYNGMRVVAVPMEKGGVGKTTLAILLATYAAEGFFKDVKKRVLVMDFDGQQNLSQSMLEMESIPNFKALLPPLHPEYDSTDPDDVEWGGRSNSVDLYYGNAVLPYPTKQSQNLDCLPSDGVQLKQFDDYQDSEDKTLLEQINQQLGKWLSQPDVQETYDLIVLDCPPGVHLITTPIMRSCTDIIVPVTLEPYGISGFHKLMREVDIQNKERVCPVNIAAVIPNKFDSRKSIHRTHWKKVQTLRDHPLYGSAIIDNPMKELADFITQQLPVNEKTGSMLAPSSPAYPITMDILDHISKRMYGRGIDRKKKSPAKNKAKTARVA